MAYEERESAMLRPHGVILEGRGRLAISGVEDVERFDELEIALRTTAGDLLVRGEELHIDRLSLDVGELAVTGRVNELSYAEPQPAGGFWARLFR